MTTSVEYNRNRYNTGTAAAHTMAQAARIAQARLGLAIDGKWGPKSQLAAALDRGAEFPDRQPADDFVALCESQIGKPYVFGAVARCDDPSPPAFDCQEIIRWALCWLAVRPSGPDGSWRMLQHCADHGLLIDVETARGIPGALLYSCSSTEPPEAPWGDRRPSSSHVAISMGDGRTIEARPSNGNAVGYQPFSGRGWRYAALIPGLAYP